MYSNCIYRQPDQAPLVLTLPIASWPKLQIEKIPAVMENFKLTATSLIDIYTGPDEGWKTITPEAVTTLEFGKSMLLRLRQSVFEGLVDKQCPGIDAEYKRQGQRRNLKRQGQAFVSPLKKTRLDNPVASSALPASSSPQMLRPAPFPHVSTVTSPPSSPSPVRQPAPFPLSSDSTLKMQDDPKAIRRATKKAARAAKKALKLAEAAAAQQETTTYLGATIRVFRGQHTPPNFPIFPDDFAFCDFVDGSAELQRLSLLGKSFNQKDMFLKVFPEVRLKGDRYPKTTLNRYRNIVLNASEELKERFRAYGSTARATIKQFVQAHDEEVFKKFGGSDTEESEAQSSTGSGTSSTHTSESEDEAGDLEWAGSDRSWEGCRAGMRSGNVEGSEDGEGYQPTENGGSESVEEGLVDEFVEEDAVLSPEMLCPYCDEKLPEKPSLKLQEMAQRLIHLSTPAPQPENSLHRNAPMSVFIDYCAQHKHETDNVARAQAEGWPLVVDFNQLASRAKEHKQALERIIDDPHTRSSFYQSAIEGRTPSTSKGKPDTRGWTTFGKQGAA